MAITNAQQFKQLVNPPMKGNKRPGYRGDAAYGDRSDKEAIGDGKATNAPSQDRIAEIRQANKTLEILKQDKLEEKLEKFRDLNSKTRQFQNFAKKFPIPKFISQFGPINLKDFFTDKYLSSKNAPMTKEQFAYLTNEEQEAMFDKYEKARGLGKIDAYGNPIGDRGRDGINQILPVDTTFVQTPSIEEQETEDNEIKNYRLMSKGGRAAFGGGSDMGTVADSKGNVGPGAGGYQGGGTGPVGRPGGPPTDVGGGIKSKFDIFNPIDSLKAKLTSFAGLTPEDIAIAKSTEDDDEDDDTNAIDTVFSEKPAADLQTVFGTGLSKRQQIEKNILDSMADGGRAGLAEGGMPYEGGIMDLESARQMYGLGKLVKKVTRTVKKIAKSPIGKAALAFGAYKLSNIGFGKSGLSAFERFGNLSPVQKALFGIGATSAIAGLMTPEEEEEQKLYAGADIDDPRYIMNNPGLFTNRRLAAEGGDIKKEPVAKKVMPLLDMDGQEMDLRAEGGFVPIGRMEKADDVPARLSKNEFVFTADAVRNAGDGSVDKGAEVMYNMMKNLESGGDVSKESQGLEGARKMFQTSQRLEEVL